jgi:hypothetical protein
MTEPQISRRNVATRRLGWDGRKITHLVELVPDDNLDDRIGNVRLELGVPPRERIEGLAI